MYGVPDNLKGKFDNFIYTENFSVVLQKISDLVETYYPTIKTLKEEEQNLLTYKFIAANWEDILNVLKNESNLEFLAQMPANILYKVIEEYLEGKLFPTLESLTTEFPELEDLINEVKDSSNVFPNLKLAFAALSIVIAIVICTKSLRDMDNNIQSTHTYQNSEHRVVNSAINPNGKPILNLNTNDSNYPLTHISNDYFDLRASEFNVVGGEVPGLQLQAYEFTISAYQRDSLDKSSKNNDLVLFPGMSLETVLQDARNTFFGLNLKINIVKYHDIYNHYQQMIVETPEGEIVAQLWFIEVPVIWKHEAVPFLFAVAVQDEDKKLMKYETPVQNIQKISHTLSPKIPALSFEPVN